MIDKVHRFIYIISIAIMGLFVLLIVLGLLFFGNYKDYPLLERFVGFLIFITPFTPIGTLFGTLKENQSTRKKMTILAFTTLSVVALVLLIWGTLVATTFD